MGQHFINRRFQPTVFSKALHGNAPEAQNVSNRRWSASATSAEPAEGGNPSSAPAGAERCHILPFAFVGRQYRLTVNNTNYYTDLVFYHIILKCYVVVDLKIGKVKQEDIGQMNLYLGYFAIDKNNEGDNPPIGIILAKEKDEVMVEYAMYGNNNKRFVSKYQMYLPNLGELRNVVFKSLKKEPL